MPYPTLSAPTTCQLEITSKCSHRCLHCYNYWRGVWSTKVGETTLTEKETNLVIKQLAQAKVFDLTFTGGEPLLAYDVLITGMRRARENNIDIHLNSNLLPLSRKRAHELKRVGLNSIVTSLMGPDATTYNSIAQHPSAFDRVVRNIHIAQDEGLGIVANMVVTKVNREKVKATARFAHSLGVRKFSATKACHPTCCKDFSRYALTLEEFRVYLHELSEVGAELGIPVDALEAYPLCGVKDLGAHAFTMHRRCTAGTNSIAIGSDGSVRPCAHYDVAYGNIFQGGLSEAWDRMFEWRDGTFLPNACKSCSLLGVCGSGCRMEAKLCNGSASAPDPYCAHEDVDHAITALQKHFETSRTKDISVKEADQFVVLPNRLRSEPFGSTVRVDGRPFAFLDNNGSRVFRQMQIGTTYYVGDCRIEWGALEPREFVSELIIRGLARLTT